MIKFAYQLAEEQVKKVIIREIPVMINESNELVCIPHSPDKPVIGIVGQRSCGKSFLCHGIIDRIFWYWREPIVSLNDLTHEMITWCNPNTSKEQAEVLSIFGEVPKPLPIVYLYPHFRGVILPKHKYYEVCVPFEFFLKNAPYFLRLKKSADYLSMNIKHILHCKSPDEIHTILKDKIKQENVVQAIMAAMQKYIEEEITDFNSNAISYVDVSSKKEYDQLLTPEEAEIDREKFPYPERKYGPIELTKEQIDYYSQAEEVFDPEMVGSFKKYYWRSRSRYIPILGFARQNLVPVLNTEQLLSKKYFHPYMYYLMDNIIHNQSRDPYWDSNNYPIWIHLEEITRIASTTLKEKTSEKIIEIAQTGRPLRMGLIWVTQDYSKAEHVLRSQTTYLFSFRLADEEQAQKIKKDRHLSNYEKEEILSLGKHEVKAMTSEKFIIYSPDGTRYETEKSQKGKSLPPLSQHKKPGS